MTQARARSGRANTEDAAHAARAGNEGGGTSADETATPDASMRILKKYPNRRLYDTQTSGYITLADVRQMVLDSERFVVRDAKTGEDLTRSILLQIILEAETGGVPMFTTPVLANLIRFYGHTLQGMMGPYLEKNIQAFTELQTRFADQSGLKAGQGFTPELWSQFMNVQAPVMQGLMSNYLDQSKNLFEQMQEQMHKQTGSLFPVGFAFGGKEGGKK